MKPLLSICMVVKNEEKVIERCLSSVVSLVDEIIVVDTGSEDQTISIAEKYTSKIYNFEWINDFSAARNFSASKATGEWILVLDADEYVDEENFKQFIEELKENREESDAYAAKIINFAGDVGENLVQHYHDRIYRNNGKIKYYRKIHEQLICDKEQTLRICKSGLLIFHSGYLKRTVDEKNKSLRNKELLDAEMMNDEKNAFDYFNYGNEYFSLGDYSKALEAYLEAYKQKKDFRLSWVSTTLIQITICLINLKRYTDALNVIHDAERIYEHSPEFLYFKGAIYQQRGQIIKAKNIFLQILNNGDKYNHIIIRPDLKDQKPHYMLGQIFLYLEDYNNAIYHFTSVLNINKNHRESINQIVSLLNKYHSETEILEFLKRNQLVNQNNLKIYIKASFFVGNPFLALQILEDHNEDNNILYELSLLKRYIITEMGSIKEFKSIINIDLIQKLIDSNWINMIDLLILSNHINDVKEFQEKTDVIMKNVKITALNDIFQGNKSVNDIDENIVINALEILFVYKKIDMCNVLLENIEGAGESLIIKVARLLFSIGLKGQALELYNLCSWDKYSEQDFDSIIKCLLEVKQNESAIEVAKYALGIFEDDYRFYDYILENTTNKILYGTILERCKANFNDYVDQ